MTNMGQCCVAGTRTFVHEKIYDEFVAKSRELALKRKIGDPFDNTTINGPQVKYDKCNLCIINQPYAKKIVFYTFVIIFVENNED